MMTSSLELSFDCKPQIYSMLSKYFGDHKTDQNIQEFLSRLEEERVKIDAFKRELPLCMQLLTNAMEASRQELESQITKLDQEGPVLEEFIPLKNTTSSLATDIVSNLSADKANWMISAQLWNQDTDPNETDINFDLNAKQRNNGEGAFLHFPSNDGNSSISAFPELALASSHKEETLEDNKNTLESISRRDNCGNSKVSEKESENTTQTQRKARRCWSPDLHRRFVNALHMLGGPHVATPKQIRELMKVDGLTNDEVKSHLQKYRLHTRSLCPTTQAAVTPAPQLVVLGGIWVPPEYAAAAAAHGGAPAPPAFYGANAAATPPFCSSARPAPQENYHAMSPPKNQLFHHSFHPHQFHVYNKAPLTKGNNSLESDIRGGAAGNPSESIEAEKSESGSWKADSGGENGSRRMRVEESNASFVSLHF